jgi:hypothetical protein
VLTVSNRLTEATLPVLLRGATDRGSGQLFCDAAFVTLLATEAASARPVLAAVSSITLALTSHNPDMMGFLPGKRSDRRAGNWLPSAHIWDPLRRARNHRRISSLSTHRRRLQGGLIFESSMVTEMAITTRCGRTFAGVYGAE